MSKITIEKKTENFTILDNTGLRDNRLSWKAKGLLAYLLHLPDDWQVYIADLKNRSKDGRDATTSAINELIENNYISREQKKEKGQFSGYEYFVYESPELNNRSGSTVTENPKTVKQITENPTLLSTNNTKLLNKPNTNKIIEKDINVFNHLWDLYEKKVDRDKAYKAFKKVSKKDIDLMLIHIPNYVKSTPDKTYRKMFSTYINGKCWNDEIIEKKEKLDFYANEQEKAKELLKKIKW